MNEGERSLSVPPAKKRDAASVRRKASQGDECTPPGAEEIAGSLRTSCGVEERAIFAALVSVSSSVASSCTAALVLGRRRE